MRHSHIHSILLTLLLLVFPIVTFAHGTARPKPVLDQVVTGMPQSERQNVRVFTAHFEPGDQTVFHSHRYPVTVYILEGTFTLEVEGKPVVEIKAGDTFIEPIGVNMTGYNKSKVNPLNLVIFYVSKPDTPFLDPVK